MNRHTDIQSQENSTLLFPQHTHHVYLLPKHSTHLKPIILVPLSLLYSQNPQTPQCRLHAALAPQHQTSRRATKAIHSHWNTALSYISSCDPDYIFPSNGTPSQGSTRPNTTITPLSQSTNNSSVSERFTAVLK